MRGLSGDMVPFRITFGIGASVLLGTIGSFILLVQGVKLLSKITERRKNRNRLATAETQLGTEYCSICAKKVDLDDLQSIVTCKGCNRSVCKNPSCSQLIDSDAWECKLCSSDRNSRLKAGEWLLQQLNHRLRMKTPINIDCDNNVYEDKSLINGKESSSSVSGVATNTIAVAAGGDISIDQRENVREFLEELLSTIIGGGSLDDITVGQMFKNNEYLPLWDHESPGVTHLNLKRLIQKVIEEVLKLPDLVGRNEIQERPEEHQPYFDPQRYEQLLATAVLNKIIDHYKDVKNQQSLSGNFSTIETTNYDNNHNEIKQNEKSQLNSPSTASTSSFYNQQSNTSISDPIKRMSLTIEQFIEEVIKSESSSSSHSPPIQNRNADDDRDDENYLSDYVQRHQIPLPDFTPTNLDSNDDFDDFEENQSFASNGTEGTWEENWLLKKRKQKSNGVRAQTSGGSGVSAAGIAMLVPSPTEEVKALIGDKTADEVSDLSEAGSDSEDNAHSDEEENFVVINNQHTVSLDSDLPNVLIQSKTVIGGKNELNSFNDPKTVDDLLQPDSLISNFSSTSDANNNIGPFLTEAKNNLLLIESERFEKPYEINEKTTSQCFNTDLIVKQENVEPLLELDVVVDAEKCIKEENNNNNNYTIIAPPAEFESNEESTKGGFITEGFTIEELAYTTPIPREPVNEFDKPVPAPRKSSKSDEASEVILQPQPEIHIVDVDIILTNNTTNIFNNTNNNNTNNTDNIINTNGVLCGNDCGDGIHDNLNDINKHVEQMLPINNDNTVIIKLNEVDSAVDDVIMTKSDDVDIIIDEPVLDDNFSKNSSDQLYLTIHESKEKCDQDVQQEDIIELRKTDKKSTQNNIIQDDNQLDEAEIMILKRQSTDFHEATFLDEAENIKATLDTDDTDKFLLLTTPLILNQVTKIHTPISDPQITPDFHTNKLNQSIESIQINENTLNTDNINENIEHNHDSHPLTPICEELLINPVQFSELFSFISSDTTEYPENNANSNYIDLTNISNEFTTDMTEVFNNVVDLMINYNNEDIDNVMYRIPEVEELDVMDPSHNEESDMLLEQLSKNTEEIIEEVKDINTVEDIFNTPILCVCPAKPIWEEDIIYVENNNQQPIVKDNLEENQEDNQEDSQEYNLEDNQEDNQEENEEVKHITVPPYICILKAVQSEENVTREYTFLEEKTKSEPENHEIAQTIEKENEEDILETELLSSSKSLEILNEVISNDQNVEDLESNNPHYKFESENDRICLIPIDSEPLSMESAYSFIYIEQELDLMKDDIDENKSDEQKDTMKENASEMSNDDKCSNNNDQKIMHNVCIYKILKNNNYSSDEITSDDTKFNVEKLEAYIIANDSDKTETITISTDIEAKTDAPNQQTTNEICEMEVEQDMNVTALINQWKSYFTTNEVTKSDIETNNKIVSETVNEIIDVAFEMKEEESLDDTNNVLESKKSIENIPLARHLLQKISSIEEILVPINPIESFEEKEEFQKIVDELTCELKEDSEIVFKETETEEIVKDFTKSDESIVDEQSEIIEVNVVEAENILDYNKIKALPMGKLTIHYVETSPTDSAKKIEENANFVEEIIDDIEEISKLVETKIHQTNEENKDVELEEETQSAINIENTTENIESLLDSPSKEKLKELECDIEISKIIPDILKIIENEIEEVQEKKTEQCMAEREATILYMSEKTDKIIISESINAECTPFDSIKSDTELITNIEVSSDIENGKEIEMLISSEQDEQEISKESNEAIYVKQLTTIDEVESLQSTDNEYVFKNNIVIVESPMDENFLSTIKMEKRFETQVDPIDIKINEQVVKEETVNDEPEENELNVLKHADKILVESENELNVIKHADEILVESENELNVLKHADEILVESENELNVIKHADEILVESEHELNVLKHADEILVESEHGFGLEVKESAVLVEKSINLVVESNDNEVIIQTENVNEVQHLEIASDEKYLSSLEIQINVNAGDDREEKMSLNDGDNKVVKSVTNELNIEGQQEDIDHGFVVISKDDKIFLDYTENANNDTNVTVENTNLNITDKELDVVSKPTLPILPVTLDFAETANKLTTSQSLNELTTTHPRYQSPILQCLLPKSQLPFVKISEQIPDDGSLNNLINMANLITQNKSAPSLNINSTMESYNKIFNLNEKSQVDINEEITSATVTTTRFDTNLLTTNNNNNTINNTTNLINVDHDNNNNNNNNIVLTSQLLTTTSIIITPKILTSTTTNTINDYSINTNNNDANLINNKNIEIEKNKIIADIIPRTSLIQQSNDIIDDGKDKKNSNIDKSIEYVDEEDDEHFVPGSIAEREHLKWKTSAVDIPNNPYSPEALQRRLTKKLPSPTDLILSSTKSYTSGEVQSQFEEQETEHYHKQDHEKQQEKQEGMEQGDKEETGNETTDDKGDGTDRSVQVVLGAGQPDYKRYGRDYYINDAKRASGARKYYSEHMERRSQSYDEDIIDDNNVDNFNINITNNNNNKMNINIDNNNNNNNNNDNNLDDKQIKKLSTTTVQRSQSYHGGGNNYVINENIIKNDVKQNNITTSESNIFSARPIFVEADDPILEKAKKLNYLSSNERDIYVVPISEITERITQHQQQQQQQQPDSLTLSEDDASTRIYNLNKCETRILREDDARKRSLEDDNSDTVEIEIINKVTNMYSLPPLTETSPDVTQKKLKITPLPLTQSATNVGKIMRLPSTPSPETIKFFAPKKIPVFHSTQSTMNIKISEPVHPPPASSSTSNLADHQATRRYDKLMIDNSKNQVTSLSTNALDKIVIEQDVLPRLPSVRALAKTFSSSSTNIDVNPALPLNKPKTVPWQTETIVEPANDKQQKQMYLPMQPGHSITARSLSKQFRNELKNSTSSSTTDVSITPLNVDSSGTSIECNRRSSSTINVNISERSPSPERPPSPLPIPGRLKSNIAFFENLKHN